jgi:hypothetical protein
MDDFEPQVGDSFSVGEVDELAGGGQILST